MATRKRARPDHRHTKAENELRKDLDVAARTIEKQAEANLAAATALDRLIDDVATRAAMRAVDTSLKAQAAQRSAEIHTSAPGFAEHQKARQEAEREQVQRNSDANLKRHALVGEAVGRRPFHPSDLPSAPTPVLSGGGTSGPGSVATSRPVSLPMVIDQLAASVDCFEGQLGDTFRTVGALLPPNFDLPEVPSTPIPTSSEPVMRIMQLIERIDRTRVRLSIITNSLTL